MPNCTRCVSLKRRLAALNPSYNILQLYDVQASSRHCLRICEQPLAARAPQKAHVPSHCGEGRQQGWQRRSRHAALHVAASGEFWARLRGIAGCGRFLPPLLTAPQPADRSGHALLPPPRRIRSRNFEASSAFASSDPCAVTPARPPSARAVTTRKKHAGEDSPSGCPPPRPLPVRHRHQMLLSPTMWISWPRPQY